MPMIPILTYPDYDGARYSRTSVDMVADLNHRIVGWTGLSIERGLVPGKGWGGRAKPQTRTRGKFDPKMTLNMYMEDYNLLVSYLAARGAAVGKGFLEVSWVLNTTLYELGLGTTIWTGLGVRIEKEAASIGTDNDDNIEVQLDLNVMDILKDGVSAVFENSPAGQIGVAL